MERGNTRRRVVPGADPRESLGSNRHRPPGQGCYASASTSASSMTDATVAGEDREPAIRPALTIEHHAPTGAAVFVESEFADIRRSVMNPMNQKAAVAFDGVAPELGGQCAFQGSPVGRSVVSGHGHGVAHWTPRRCGESRFVTRAARAADCQCGVADAPNRAAAVVTCAATCAMNRAVARATRLPRAAPPRRIATHAARDATAAARPSRRPPARPLRDAHGVVAQHLIVTGVHEQRRQSRESRHRTARDTGRSGRRRRHRTARRGGSSRLRTSRTARYSRRATVPSREVRPRAERHDSGGQRRGLVAQRERQRQGSPPPAESPMITSRRDRCRSLRQQVVDRRRAHHRARPGYGCSGASRYSGTYADAGDAPHERADQRAVRLRRCRDEAAAMQIQQHRPSGVAPGHAHELAPGHPRPSAACGRHDRARGTRHQPTWHIAAGPCLRAPTSGSIGFSACGRMRARTSRCTSCDCQLGVRESGGRVSRTC